MPHEIKSNSSPSVVLIIEDEPGDAELIRWQLLEHDANAFVVHEADSLRAAGQLLDGGVVPDVVLLDLNLPDSTGTRSVERCQTLTDAPIVVLTGIDDATAMRVAIESGAEDYLAKGGDGQSLRRSIRYAMLRHRREADARLAATVFSHAREGVVITDPAANIIDVNRAFTRITGYPRAEVIGRNPRILRSGRHGSEFYQEMWRELLTNDYWYGEMWNRRKNGEIFIEMLTISAVRDPRGRLRHLVGLFSDITLQKEHERQLKHIAHYDALTSLPNRVLLTDRLHQAILRAKRSGQRLGLAYIDLDGFKAINDNHGHEVGDRLLMAIGERMRHAVRESDTIARLGGDEFVAVLAELDPLDNDLCHTLVQRLLAAASHPLHVDGRVLQVSASIGVTFYPQEDGIDADQLLRQADQAMYQAKLAGKNRYHIFDAEQDRNLRGHHEELKRIEQGLERNEFILHYQPKVNMCSGEVIGVEALIRWQHPERGLLSPATFLHQVEQHPLSARIDQWVLQQALHQLQQWQQQGVILNVGVNIAPQYLQQPDFVTQLTTLLALYPELSPSQLSLEVLESSALADIANVSAVIRDCARIGVGFSLDDFGTGYSSLTYLKRLPAHELKIDQSFVRDMLHDPDDLAILEGVLGLATAFRRQIIAEGVESIEHGVLLLQLGCERAQGYGIARPMSASQILEWLPQWQPPEIWRQTRKIPFDALPLLHASVEHRAWVQAVTDYFHGEREVPPQLAPTECRFGRWLEGLSERQDATTSEIRRIHLEVHRLVEKLLRVESEQGSKVAKTHLVELYSQRDQLLALLPKLLEQIVHAGE